MEVHYIEQQPYICRLSSLWAQKNCSRACKSWISCSWLKDHQVRKQFCQSQSMTFFIVSWQFWLSDCLPANRNQTCKHWALKQNKINKTWELVLYSEIFADNRNTSMRWRYVSKLKRPELRGQHVDISSGTTKLAFHHMMLQRQSQESMEHGISPSYGS